jgi:hypothetical protein
VYCFCTFTAEENCAIFLQFYKIRKSNNFGVFSKNVILFGLLVDFYLKKYCIGVSSKFVTFFPHGIMVRSEKVVQLFRSKVARCYSAVDKCGQAKFAYCNDPLCVYFYSIFKTPISQNSLSCMHVQAVAHYHSVK